MTQTQITSPPIHLVAHYFVPPLVKTVGNYFDNILDMLVNLIIVIFNISNHTALTVCTAMWDDYSFILAKWYCDRGEFMFCMKDKIPNQCCVTTNLRGSREIAEGCLYSEKVEYNWSNKNVVEECHLAFLNCFESSRVVKLRMEFRCDWRYTEKSCWKIHQHFFSFVIIGYSNN